MAAEVVVFDGLNVAPRVSPHRKTVLRITDLFELADERRLRTGMSRHQAGAYYSPRHRHNFDQVRFTLEGAVKYGPIQTQAGDAVYFPEGVFYGPTEVVSEEALTWTIQTQGPTWGFFPDRPLLESTTAELAAEAELDRDHGRIRWPSGRWQDSYEAAWERIMGQKMVYPPARYLTPVLLRASNFSWVPRARVPGVSEKAIARFNETGPTITMLRIEPGASLPGGQADAHQIAAVVTGSARYGDQAIARGTILYYPPGATYAPINADEPCEILAIQVVPKAAAPIAADALAAAATA